MPLHYRLATEADLPTIVQLLADDALGQTRETYQLPLPDTYLRAFAAIQNDPHQELTVVERNGQIVGTFQLSLLQLTSDKQRPDAIRFYESLGFVASHEGMKLHL
jgi:N-acetylglutamate synthase-like GNAT family acetyltransferase